MSSTVEAWWVFGLHDGKPILLGPYNSEEEAVDMGGDKVNGDFEPIILPTRDEARATRIIRHRRLRSGNSMSQSLEKMRHKPVAGKGSEYEL